jgi:predicted nucleotide-binding protein
VDYPDHAQNFRAYLAKSKEDAIALLRQAVRGLKEEIGDRRDLSAAPIDIAPAIISPAHNRKVFVVHGREEGPREAVARFLERLGFEPIILHEQANQGRTVIENVENNSDVGFAVIILTPDDMGNLKGEEPQPRSADTSSLERNSVSHMLILPFRLVKRSEGRPTRHNNGAW